MSPQPNQPTESRVFYSAHAALVININNGHRITEGNGVSRIVDQKVVEFMPMADGFGRLVTDDPEVIAKLSARCGAQSDVFDAAEYNRRSTPMEVQVAMLQDQNARLLEDHNRLLASLAEKQAVNKPGAAPSK